MNQVTRGQIAKALLQAAEQLDFDCLDSSDDPMVFYHATPATNLPAILKHGLKRGLGQTFDTEGWSTGKIFLSYGLKTGRQWQEAIYEMTFEPVSLLEIRLGSAQRSTVQVDSLASREGDSCVYFIESDVKPHQIRVVDHGEL